MNNQSIKLETMTIASAGKLIQDQKISIEHLTQATLEQVHVTEPKINAFINLLKWSLSGYQIRTAANISIATEYTMHSSSVLHAHKLGSL